jgi:hypothetical protein
MPFCILIDVTLAAERSQEMATMIVTSNTNRRKALRRFLSAFFGFTKKPTTRGVVWEQTPVLNQALQTIRMAANAGEDYEIVAARIETQAAAYLKFLENPQPIGRVSLNVKQFGPVSSVTDHVREQYRINEPSEGQADPAEGHASVWYTFNRSNNKVLEFIVHDQNDNELFPIARTYTDWIGTKKFDLGLDRTFYLSLMEGAPGYVNVRAGFVEPNEIETAIYDAFKQAGASSRNTVSNTGTPSLQSGRLPFVLGSGILGLFGIFAVAIFVSMFHVKIPWITAAHKQANHADDYTAAGLQQRAQDAGQSSRTRVTRTQQMRVTK